MKFLKPIQNIFFGLMLMAWSALLFSQTVLPTCKGGDVRQWHSCRGVIDEDEYSYAGDFMMGKFDGRGILEFTADKYQGDHYQGEFKNGLKHGFGMYFFSNGDKYVGEYKDSKKHGQGTFTFADGSKWVGAWENSNLNGHAITYYADGSINQEGIFKDDEFLYAQETSPNIISKDNQDDKVINASSGSGFAVSSDGYVITNNHVIEGCQEVIVHTKEKDIKTRIISFDPQNDLALLKGDFQPKTVFALSNNRPELLQDIYVAGYPFGNSISSSIKVTKGIISSLTGIGNNYSNIQFDAALQPGNSGGPIIDNNGNLIGKHRKLVPTWAEKLTWTSGDGSSLKIYQILF